MPDVRTPSGLFVCRRMSLERKLKNALGETRLLILGAQVLFGFQFNGVFQELFEELPQSSRYLQCIALLLITGTIGLLVAPSMRHRLVEGGQDTNNSSTATTLFAGAALLPLALALSLDAFVSVARIYGFGIGLASGAALFVLAILRLVCHGASDQKG